MDGPKRRILGCHYSTTTSVSGIISNCGARMVSASRHQLTTTHSSIAARDNNSEEILGIGNL